MGYRPHPRVSLLALAEYQEASPSRRWSIIQDHAYPPDQIVPQYRRARAAARAFFRSGGEDPTVLTSAIERMDAITPSSEWQERDLRNSAEALRRLVEVDGIRLGSRVLRTRQTGNRMTGGVVVSVSPTVAVLEGNRVGAIKSRWGKSRTLSETEAKYAATVLRVFVQERLDGLPQVVDPDLCQVVDVWEGAVTPAPRAYKRRMQRVVASCQEIDRMWPRPEPPFTSPGIQPGIAH